MTYTEISKAAGERLIELCGMALFDAAKNCINSEMIAGTTDEDVIAQIYENLKPEELYYFAESTIAKPPNPIEHIEARIRNGFVTGGVNIDLTKVPIWSDFADKSRNIRYKIHSWLMIDGFLNADQVTDGDKYLQMASNIAVDWVQRFVINMESC